MPLKLNPQTVGVPDWRELLPGELTITTSQWYRAQGGVPSTWEVVPWFSSDGYLARADSPNYRVAVSRKAKWSAWWTAVPKYIKYRLLRMKQKGLTLIEFPMKELASKRAIQREGSYE